MTHSATRNHARHALPNNVDRQDLLANPAPAVAAGDDTMPALTPGSASQRTAFPHTMIDRMTTHASDR